MQDNSIPVRLCDTVGNTMWTGSVQRQDTLSEMQQELCVRLRQFICGTKHQALRLYGPIKESSQYHELLNDELLASARSISVSIPDEPRIYYEVRREGTPARSWPGSLPRGIYCSTDRL